jgi:hypothetical protein
LASQNDKNENLEKEQKDINILKESKEQNKEIQANDEKYQKIKNILPNSIYN